MRFTIPVCIGALLSIPTAALHAQTKSTIAVAPPPSAIKAPNAVPSAASLAASKALAIRLAQLQKALAGLDQARSAAEYIKAVGSLRDVMRQDPMTGAPRSTERTIPGARPSRGAPPGALPAGAPDQSINDRLAQRKPRGTIVGPGAIPTGSLGLVSSASIGKQEKQERVVHTVTSTRTDPDGGTTHASVSHEKGRVTRVEVSHYDSDGHLSSYDITQFDADGTQDHMHGDVIRSDRSGRATVLVDSWTQRGGQVEVHSADGRRPHSPRIGDPPLEVGDLSRYQPVEGTGGKDAAAWCNPINGHCYKAGIRTSSTYVNPGPGEPMQTIGPLIIPRGAAVNPNPHAVDSSRIPRTIPKAGAGPGARPPQKAKGPPNQGD